MTVTRVPPPIPPLPSQIGQAPSRSWVDESICHLRNKFRGSSSNEPAKGHHVYEKVWYNKVPRAMVGNVMRVGAFLEREMAECAEDHERFLTDSSIYNFRRCVAMTDAVLYLLRSVRVCLEWHRRDTLEIESWERELCDLITQPFEKSDEGRDLRYSLFTAWRSRISWVNEKCDLSKVAFHQYLPREMPPSPILPPKVWPGSGKKIPRLAFGTWKLEHGDCREAVIRAVQSGIYHIDTASWYKNLEHVRSALEWLFANHKIVDSDGEERLIERRDIFLNAKIEEMNCTPENVSKAVQNQLVQLGVEYLDMVMMHQFPKENWERCWRLLEAAVADKIIVHLGVSNIEASQLKQLCKFARVKPAAMQVKFSPYCQGGYFDVSPSPTIRQLFHFAYDNDIAIFAVSLFDKVWYNLEPLQDDLVRLAAESLSVSPANCLVRWAFSFGIGCVCRSSKPSHMLDLVVASESTSLSGWQKDLISSLTFLVASPLRIPTLCNDFLLTGTEVDMFTHKKARELDRTPREEQDERARRNDPFGGFDESDVVAANKTLARLLVNGNWPATLEKVGAAYKQNELNAVFDFVLVQNIREAEKRGYAVKHRVFTGILEHVKRLRVEETQRHAPVYDAAIVKLPSTTSDALPIESLNCIIDLHPEDTAAHARAAAHLKEHGYVVFENAFPLEQTQELKEEFKAMRPHFQESEIWVGKGETGAQVNIPDVRSDRVLWMCGGHRSGDHRLFDSAGQQPTSQESVEPCRPDIKAACPLKQFSALQTFLKVVDSWVVGFCKNTKGLELVCERSDCMIAHYPGKGARFQRHVDNTTKDGRKLSVVIYFNKQWKSENFGGDLRVWPSSLGGTHAPVDISPQAGRVVMFYADSTHHEVLPCKVPRFAVTLWYYDATQRLEALERRPEAQISSSHWSHQPLCGTLPQKAQDMVATILGVRQDPFHEWFAQLDAQAWMLLRSRTSSMGIEGS
eukprot:gene1094-1031_t